MNRASYQQPFGNRPPPPYFHGPFTPSPRSYYSPELHVTPYEVYRKPAQPLDLLQPNGGENAYQTGANEATSGLLGAFTDENGQVNIDKAMGTINQLAGVYHQVTPIVKQLTSLFQAFRQ